MSRANLKHPGGFTLVELLVVVGIITMLVAVLLPALGKAREHADRIKCAANLRSLGQALTMYTQQYGYYPGGNATSGYVAAVWPVRLRPFLGGEHRAFNCPAQDERCAWVHGAPTPILPGQPAAVADGFLALYGYEPGEPLITAHTYFSYGYNYAGTQISASGDDLGLGVVQLPTAPAAREIRASRVKDAADMIAIADSDADGILDCVIQPERAGAVWLPGRVHGGGPNVLFCDGHVQWYRLEDITYDSSVSDDADGPRRLRVRRMWNHDHKAHVYGVE